MGNRPRLVALGPSEPVPTLPTLPWGALQSPVPGRLVWRDTGAQDERDVSPCGCVPSNTSSCTPNS